MSAPQAVSKGSRTGSRTGSRKGSRKDSRTDSRTGSRKGSRTTSNLFERIINLWKTNNKLLAYTLNDENGTNFTDTKNINGNTKNLYLYGYLKSYLSRHDSKPIGYNLYHIHIIKVSDHYAIYHLTCGEGKNKEHLHFIGVDYMGNLIPKPKETGNIINNNINDPDLTILIKHFKYLLFDKCLSEGMHKYNLPHLEGINPVNIANSLKQRTHTRGGSRKLRKKSKKYSDL
jgi:hypothetical protein